MPGVNPTDHGEIAIGGRTVGEFNNLVLTHPNNSAKGVDVTGIAKGPATLGLPFDGDRIHSMVKHFTGLVSGDGQNL